MTAAQMIAWATEMERLGEELATNAHALIIQARDIQRRAERVQAPAMHAPIPDGPEISE